MTELKLPQRALRALRAGPLRGEFSPPGDRGLTARALIIAALAFGESRIAGYAETADTDCLLTALRSLGAEIETEAGIAYIQGLGVGGFLEPPRPLALGGHGAAAALAMGLVGMYPFETTIAGDPSLANRDFNSILEPLRMIGITARADEDRFLPVTVRGPRSPVALELHLAHDSLAKSAVLLAALTCPGITSIVEPVPTRADTELLLQTFGARIMINDLPGRIRVTEITGLPDLRGRTIAVPADPGYTLYPMVAALLIPGSTILLTDVLATDEHMALVLTLIEMGADITLINRREVDGFGFADIRARHSPLKGVEVPLERVAELRRDYHLLALAAAFATGTTTMPGLSIPEDWDILTELAAALTEAGAKAEREPERLVVNGAGRLRGGITIRTSRDPALTATALLMGMAARDPITIDDDSGAPIAYPGFVERFEALGVRFSRNL